MIPKWLPWAAGVMSVIAAVLTTIFPWDRNPRRQSGDFIYEIADTPAVEKTAGYVGWKAARLFHGTSTATVVGYAGDAEILKIPGTLDGHRVVSVGPMAFYGNTTITSVAIPTGVVDIGEEAFADCLNLTHVTIPEGIATIGRMAFHGCARLSGVVLPASLRRVGDGMFNNCAGLAHVAIPDGTVRIEDRAFHGCAGLTNVAIPSSVVSIEPYAFSGCAGLSKITIPPDVTTIGAGAFSFCDGLTSVAIPSGVTDIGVWAFGRCSSLREITVDTGNPNYSSLDGVLFDKNQTKLIQYPPGKAGAYTIPSSVALIGNLAFEDCAELTGVTIPSSVARVADRAFYRCSALEDATFLGDAPDMGDYVFEETSKSFTVSHFPGKKDWSNPWNEYPARPLPAPADSERGGP